MVATTTMVGATGSGVPLARFRGGRTRIFQLISFDITSYDTGGTTLPTAASLGLSVIDAVVPVVTSATATAYIPVWDSTNKKLIMNTTTSAQAASTTAIGPVTLLVIGR